MTIPSQPAERAMILVTIADERARAAVVDQLRHRYSSDYEVVQWENRRQAHLLVDQANRVALVLSDFAPSAGQASTAKHETETKLDDVEDPSVTSLFAAVKRRFPESRRALVIKAGSWADPGTAESVLALMGSNVIDAYVQQPTRFPDEGFHHSVTELLHEWARSGAEYPGDVVVIGDDAQPRTHDIRRFLARGGVSFESVEPDLHPDSPAKPIVRMADGQLLVDPSNTQLARAMGLDTELPGDTVDLAVVGAGPAGLAAAVYAASEGLNVLVAERDAVGGQAGSSSLIRNYLGFARGISGAELSERAYQQAWAFGARFAQTREVVGMEKVDDAFLLHFAPDEYLSARTVILATGVSYRRLAIPGLDPYVGSAVFYGVSAVEAKAQSGRQVHIIGGGNSAGQAALHLARYANQVSLIVRGRDLAESMSQYLLGQLIATGVQIRTEAKVVGGGGSDGRLQHLVVQNRSTGEQVTVDSDALFVTIGAAPHTLWLPPEVLRDQWGYILTGADVVAEGGRRSWPHDRPPNPLETSMPGCFAVGDVRRASVKRVAAAVGEGSVVISAVHGYLAAPSPV